MTLVRIKVVKKSVHADLAKAYGAREIEACGMLEEGQEFVTGFQKPEGFCDWAWNDIQKPVFALLTGGSFDRGAFKLWMRDEGKMIACCTDGFRPVSFLLERLDSLSLIDLSGVRDPAPREVYASERWGEFDYLFPGLEAGKRHALRLHFAEISFSAEGRRAFRVDVNGARAIEGLDIVKATGGAFKALVIELEAVADAEGRILVSFRKGSADMPKLSGIEVLPEGSGKAAYAINSGGESVGAFSADSFFQGGNAAGG